eukprot:782460-Amphidinium_carterae.1
MTSVGQARTQRVQPPCCQHAIPAEIEWSVISPFTSCCPRHRAHPCRLVKCLCQMFQGLSAHQLELTEVA